MAKLTLTDLANLTNETTAVVNINNNNAAIETALENTLSRDGTSPNAMGVALDMNSYKVNNVAAPVAGGDAVNKTYVDDATSAIIAAGLPVQTGNSGKSLQTDGTDATWQAILPASVYAVADGNFLVADGAAWVVESGATVRSSLGLAIGTNVQAWAAVLDGTTASYTTTEESKLSAIEPSATADQTDAEIKTAYENNTDTNEFSDAEQTKLTNIEALADITDAANVAAAGGVLNTGNETIGGIKTFSSDPLIPDEAYAAGWDTKLEPPTKNAVYDKIEGLSAGETILKVVKATDESVTSSVTLQDDDELTITLVANKVYKFDAMVLVESASATPDYKGEWVEPDGTFDFIRFIYGSGAYADFRQDETSGAVTLAVTSGDTYWHLFRGIIRVGGTGGTFKLQWAQNTSDGTATTVKAGSWMRAVQLD